LKELTDGLNIVANPESINQSPNQTSKMWPAKEQHANVDLMDMYRPDYPEQRRHNNRITDEPTTEEANLESNNHAINQSLKL